MLGPETRQVNEGRGVGSASKRQLAQHRHYAYHGPFRRALECNGYLINNWEILLRARIVYFARSHTNIRF
jgi:hypothetical protein